VLELTGAERVKFLQDLITNDIENIGAALVYAALLTPQGKYLFDFFVFARDDSLFVDVASDQAAALQARLTMYRLRADVTIGQSDLVVSRGIANVPVDALGDPRHPALGWRHYGATDQSDPVNWDDIRATHCIPKAGAELISGETYILEAGFDRLNGVDFKKGCYVGQEIIARMKHKTELKKGFVSVMLDGRAETGDEVHSGDRKIGRLTTVNGGRAIAYLRFERIADSMTAGQAKVTRT